MIFNRGYTGRAFTGAWIETSDRTPLLAGLGGRAFTGAWIETNVRFE